MRGVVFVLLGLAVVGAQPPRGVPRVVDGDTLRMAGEGVWLTGIDAPEAGQQCAATQALRQRIAEWSGRCDVAG